MLLLDTDILIACLRRSACRKKEGQVPPKIARHDAWPQGP